MCPEGEDINPMTPIEILGDRPVFQMPGSGHVF